MISPRFLTTEEVLTIHKKLIEEYGGSEGIRDIGLLKSAIGAPQATFGGHFLMSLFEMAATYVISITSNHPFIDGNKRTGAATATIFLFYNGYLLNETYNEELADKILDCVTHKIGKKELTAYFKKYCKSIT